MLAKFYFLWLVTSGGVQCVTGVWGEVKHPQNV